MELRKDKPKSQGNFPVCQNIIYSGILAFSTDEIDFKILEAQIKKRALEKEWKAAKDFKIETIHPQMTPIIADKKIRKKICVRLAAL